MIRYLALLTTLLILTSSGCGKKRTCQEFRTGTFKYNDEEFKDVEILRTEDEQIESSEKRDYSDTYQIHWTSECEYYLVFKRTTNAERMPFSKFDTIFAKITSITDSSYIYKARISNSEFKPEGELLQIK